MYASIDLVSHRLARHLRYRAAHQVSLTLSGSGICLSSSLMSPRVFRCGWLRRFKDRKLAVRKDAKFAEAAPDDILEAMAAQQAAAVRYTDPPTDSSYYSQTRPPTGGVASYHSSEDNLRLILT